MSLGGLDEFIKFDGVSRAKRLLKNPEKLGQIKAEIKDAFGTVEEFKEVLGSAWTASSDADKKEVFQLLDALFSDDDGEAVLETVVHRDEHAADVSLDGGGEAALATVVCLGEHAEASSSPELGCDTEKDRSAPEGFAVDSPLRKPVHGGRALKPRAAFQFAKETQMTAGGIRRCMFEKTTGMSISVELLRPGQRGFVGHPDARSHIMLRDKGGAVQHIYTSLDVLLFTDKHKREDSDTLIQDAFMDKVISRGTRLGEGAFGRVRVGSDDLHSVVKTPNSKSRTIRHIREAIKETESYHLLGGDHIVRLESVGVRLTEKNEFKIYVELESMAGGDLADFSRAHLTGLSPEERAVAINKIAEDMVSGLQSLEEKGVMHRDIKPANVLVLQDGATVSPVENTYKFGDLGSVRTIEETRGPLREWVVGKDVDIFGFTKECCSPELWSAISGKAEAIETIDQRVDVWATGITLALLVTGKIFSNAKNSIENTHAALAEVRAALPDTDQGNALYDRIEKMLTFDVADRPLPSEL